MYKKNTVVDAKKTGKKIKENMKLAGYSQVQLARTLGVSDVNVSHWILGRCYPTLDTFVKLADLLGVYIDDLIVRCDDDNSREN